MSVSQNSDDELVTDTTSITRKQNQTVLLTVVEHKI
jgi:hypothetical protein